MHPEKSLFLSLLSFLAGAALGLLPAGQALFLIFLSAATGASLAAAFPRKYLLPAILLPLALAGGFLLASREVRFWEESLPLKERDFSGTVRIWGEVAQKEAFQEVILKEEECEKGACLERSILWQAPLSRDLQPGSRLAFRCLLRQPESFTPDFDYRMFLAKEDVLFICRKGEGVFEPLPGDKGTVLSRSLYGIKGRFEAAIEKVLPQPESGLAKGLLLGGGSHLPRSLEDAFSRVGISHIVAVSGYNITLVAELFLALGILCGLFRRQALIASVLGIALFVFLIGAPASALRASLMAGIGFSAMHSGRIGKPVNALLLAAALMLFFNPLLLRYDIGFQLSFLATLAIIFGAPWFERLFPRVFPGKKLLEIAWLTFIVELFVVPLLLFHFQTFSWMAFASNILLLPLVPLAMALSFAAALSFLLLPGAHFLFSWTAYLFLTAITRFAEFFGAIPSITLSVPSPSILFLSVWYALLIGSFLSLEEWQARKWYAEAFSFPRHR